MPHRATTERKIVEKLLSRMFLHVSLILFFFFFLNDEYLQEWGWSVWKFSDDAKQKKKKNACVKLKKEIQSKTCKAFSTTKAIELRD